jgi:exonuclease SbcD
MRILHTSDWHLGRSLHGHPLGGAQAAFVDFLVDVTATEGVAAVLVAGDLYDRAIPPVDAVELFGEALARLAALRVPLVLVSGNHDSGPRLGFGTDLIAAAGVHLRTDPARAAEPVVLADEHGPVVVYALPYLEPELTWAALGAAAPRHEAVMAAAMADVRADLATRPAGTRSVVVAHAFVAGVGRPDLSDSERDISVGGSALTSTAVFDGIDYVALGHLHGFQQPVADRVVYCGSPIAYSFSEEHQTKSVSLVDLAADGSVRTRQVPTPVTRPVARIRGSLASLLTDDRWTAYERHLLAVTLTDVQVPSEPMDRLRARFPGVLHLTVTSHRPAAGDSYTSRLAGLDDLALASRFVEDMWQRHPSADELALLRAGFEAQRIHEVTA